MCDGNTVELVKLIGHEPKEGEVHQVECRMSLSGRNGAGSAARNDRRRRLRTKEASRLTYGGLYIAPWRLSWPARQAVTAYVG